MTCGSHDTATSVGNRLRGDQAMHRRKLFLILPALVLLASRPVRAAGKTHRLALQVSDNDPEKMTAALNVAANVSRFYSDQGDEVEIVIVAFNAGLHMLRTDTSPVKARLDSFAQSMPNVSFIGCGNTVESMKKSEHKDIVLVPQAKVEPAGGVTLIELAEKGYVIVRP
jgi:intracellular sulfur oxidation DsrE/DsrF family protein